MFCHSPESLKELWDGQVFKKGTVKVAADLHVIDVRPDRNISFMWWSVTRT
jgi:hypothetical protein